MPIILTDKKNKKISDICRVSFVIDKSTYSRYSELLYNVAIIQTEKEDATAVSQ